MIKEKKRYIAFKVRYRSTNSNILTSIDVIKWISRFFVAMFGEVNAAEANIRLIEYDEIKNVGIIRMALTQLDNFKTAMALIRRYHGEDARVEIIGVSGTIRKCKEKFIIGKR